MKNIPKIPDKVELIGKALILKTPEEEDYPKYRDIFMNPKNNEFLRYRADLYDNWSLEKIREVWHERLRAQKLQKGLHLSFYLKKSGKLVGFGGFDKIDLSDGWAEYGLVVDHSSWGTIVTPEASFLMAQYAFEQLQLHRLECTTLMENVRSRKVLEKSGISLESVRKEAVFFDGEYIDQGVYVFFDRDWPEIKKKLLYIIDRHSSSGR